MLAGDALLRNPHDVIEDVIETVDVILNGGKVAVKDRTSTCIFSAVDEKEYSACSRSALANCIRTPTSVINVTMG